MQESKKWTFWIDCGGTFTDLLAIKSKTHKVKKVLSHSPHYKSAVIEGIKEILGHENFLEAIQEIRLGTTVATNAFLENKGVDCALITTLGHRDVLEIRNQNRSDLFALDIKKRPPFYKYVTSIKGRMNAAGEITAEFDEEIARFELQRILDQGIKSLAISLLHSTINPEHELKLYDIAKKMGFSYISLSHQVAPIANYVARTDTTVIDSYLSPYLKQYTQDLEAKLGIKDIYYMQSDGGLCKAEDLKGYNALLSGPAGGLVGAVDIAKKKGINKIITFDMGGTSTDVAIYDQELSIDPTPNFYGINLLCPMLDIHTVAAGGGSILKYNDGRFQVGPESAGSFPGPACYRNGGPLTVTDANLFLKRLEPSKFPKIFGKNQNLPLDEEIVAKKFKELEDEINLPAKEIAEGFLDVAVESMAQAIRKVTIEKGHDPQGFCLVSFGGAAGQLALKVAETLSIKRVLIHPLSSILSAYGMGKGAYQLRFDAKSTKDLPKLQKLAKTQFPFKDHNLENIYLLSAKGSNHQVEIRANSKLEAFNKFKNYHNRTFGTRVEKIECISVACKISAIKNKDLTLEYSIDSKKGPLLINENNTSIKLENNWSAYRAQDGIWDLTKSSKSKVVKRDVKIELEIFYQRFQFIAEQMGFQLKKLAESINIKERNDFSCALFTKSAELIANAPHIPVHLGSMDEAVKAVKNNCKVRPGESYILNAPFYGGTHLPDVTIVTPLFYKRELIMWLASRGHHADIGGKTPGSMPGDSKKLSEEGVIIAPTKIFANSVLKEDILKKILTEATYPVRNYEMNLRDIQAKISANNKGIEEILKLVDTYSVAYIEKMSEKILSYTHKKTLKVLSKFKETSAHKVINSKRELRVKIYKEKEQTIFDFAGTSKALNTNFNAPKPVLKATIMFALRSMLKENIPLNSGIMRAIQIKVPNDCMLNPGEGAPVVAGNVETSQALCDLFYEAFKVKANSYGSMNNLSFGNDFIQYYETICGGSGASASYNGANAVQVNMTNSLLTDPEIFETRMPVAIELMGIRHGSGGAGKFHGGDGVYRRLKFLDNVSLNLITQSREIPPKGVCQGESAQRGLNQLESKDGWEELSECVQMKVKKGTRISISTPGGAGFGEAKKELGHLIFGFGSNMDLSQIKSRCPSAKLICRGSVFDKEIRYTRYSPTRKGGVADMYNAPSHRVYGLIISVNDEDLAFLDKIECADNEYQRVPIHAYDDNGHEIQCECYDVIDKKPDIAPTKVYEWLVYSGAFYLNAPNSYLNKILSYRN